MWAQPRPQGPLGCVSPLGRQCVLTKLPPDSRANPRTSIRQAVSPARSDPARAPWEALKLKRRPGADSGLPTLRLLALFPLFSLFASGKAGPCHSEKEISIKGLTKLWISLWGLKTGPSPARGPLEQGEGLGPATSCTHFQASSCLSHGVWRGEPLFPPHSPGAPLSPGIHPPALEPARAAPFNPPERSKAWRRRSFLGDSVPRPLISQARWPGLTGPHKAGIVIPAHHVHSGCPSSGPST